MAGNSLKKQAANNKEILITLWTGSISVDVLFLSSYFFLGNPSSIIPWVIFSIPAAVVMVHLEKTCRPKFDERGGLIRPGEDLAQRGVMEYLKDIVYVTWICKFVSAVLASNWGFALYIMIPLYAVVKAYTLYSENRPKHSTASGSTANEGLIPKSKRQEKMERRGGQKVTYRS
ncbi:hypothetical protein CJU90_4030 [Yarrowia sp. C11]|nr:hypothetical protein CKK34_5640 [Yarrowia sp. E02]KAG5367725.1 hypothetical protein CJU90_4030 [Yarrowia sp. C11]